MDRRGSLQAAQSESEYATIASEEDVEKNIPVPGVPFAYLIVHIGLLACLFSLALTFFG